MPGEVRVTIGDVSWDAYLAIDPWELAQGLGGIASIAPNTGMFFDVGSDRVITVTTEAMLFNIDIVIISSALKVIEVYNNVVPGSLITASANGRYFLEVNAGEASEVKAGDNVNVSLIPILAPVPPVYQGFDWSVLMGYFMYIIFGVVMVSVVVLSFTEKEEETARLKELRRMGIPEYAYGEY